MDCCCYWNTTLAAEEEADYILLVVAARHWYHMLPAGAVARRTLHLPVVVDVAMGHHRILRVAALVDCFDPPKLELQTTLYPPGQEYQRACFLVHAAVAAAAATHYCYSNCMVQLDVAVAACVGLPFGVVAVAAAAAAVVRMDEEHVVPADAADLP